MLLVTSSCSLFRDPTVEDLIADLPKYDDSEEIKWSSLRTLNGSRKFSCVVKHL